MIAVVGASRDPGKPAHGVPLQMQRYGWRIIPVNPTADELFGERVYRVPGRHPVPGRPGQRLPPRATTPSRWSGRRWQIGAPAVWLQLGIVSPQARQIAEEAGIDYVEDRCLAVERAVAALTGPTPRR